MDRKNNFKFSEIQGDNTAIHAGQLHSSTAQSSVLCPAEI